MITVEDLRVKLGGSEVLKGVDAVFRGKHVVLGPNGSGKTTLFRAIAGLVPYKGRIEIDGRPLRGLGALWGFSPPTSRRSTAWLL